MSIKARLSTGRSVQLKISDGRIFRDERKGTVGFQTCYRFFKFLSMCKERELEAWRPANPGLQTPPGSVPYSPWMDKAPMVRS